MNDALLKQRASSVTSCDPPFVSVVGSWELPSAASVTIGAFAFATSVSHNLVRSSENCGDCAVFVDRVSCTGATGIWRSLEFLGGVLDVELSARLALLSLGVMKRPAGPL